MITDVSDKHAAFIIMVSTLILSYDIHLLCPYISINHDEEGREFLQNAGTLLPNSTV
jgi:hypothetical protein